MAKRIQYTIEARLWTDVEYPDEIHEYLDKLREIGEAKITAVEIVDREE